MDEKIYELILEEPATEEELGGFKKKIKERRVASEERERPQFTLAVAMGSSKVGTIKLFARGFLVN